MVFADTLLNETSKRRRRQQQQQQQQQKQQNPPLKVILVDRHSTPGGQWHDSYDFVRLHQPSSMYGVESKKLEEKEEGSSSSSSEEEEQRRHHRATRTEILEYYDAVGKNLEESNNFDFFEFVGDADFDLEQIRDGNPSRTDYEIKMVKTGNIRKFRVRKRLVDARNLEPDIPVSTPPKFTFPDDKVRVVPVNDLVQEKTTTKTAENNNNNNNGSSNHPPNNKKAKHFVVVGGGKTGMDAVYHLLTAKGLSVDDLLWIVPNDAWITARENIGNCIDLLHESCKLHRRNNINKSNSGGSGSSVGSDFLQTGFLEWEKQGHVYRLDPSVIPTKFKDATLSSDELQVLKKVVPRMVRKGRVTKILETGAMVFQNNDTLDLPFPSVDHTVFVHCSAGAFHFTKSNKSPPPIFQEKRIVTQDFYGTPGYCFVGSMLGKLESITDLSDEQRNSMTLRSLPSPSPSPLGPSGGDVLCDNFGENHQFVQRAKNLRSWLRRPDLREWMFQSRLFHFADIDPADVAAKTDDIFDFLREKGIVVTDT